MEGITETLKDHFKERLAAVQEWHRHRRHPFGKKGKWRPEIERLRRRRA